MPKGREEDYVDTGASIEDAAMDLSPADFMALMAELGREMFGPAPKPEVAEPAEPPAVDKAERMNRIRERIRGLIRDGVRANPTGVSPFTADLLMQRRMESYGHGAAGGTGESAAAMAERIRRGL